MNVLMAQLEGANRVRVELVSDSAVTRPSSSTMALSSENWGVTVMYCGRVVG